jgi:hypothetical protein
MKLLTAWMEVLANLGVLVGIVFLTLEVSQNTLATKSQASLAVQMAISDRIAEATNNPALFDAIAKSYADEELSEKDKLLFSFYLHANLTAIDAALTQYNLGVIDTNVVESFDSELLMMTHQLEYSRENWKYQASSFSPALQQHVAGLIAAREREIEARKRQ